jgi:hypothetical protein
LNVTEQDGTLPHGYGIHTEEWPEDHYPTAELIQSGRKGVKTLRVPLPVHIWKPRAEKWVRALWTLNKVLLEAEMGLSDTEIEEDDNEN